MPRANDDKIRDKAHYIRRIEEFVFQDRAGEVWISGKVWNTHVKTDDELSFDGILRLFQVRSWGVFMRDVLEIEQANCLYKTYADYQLELHERRVFEEIAARAKLLEPDPACYGFDLACGESVTVRSVYDTTLRKVVEQKVRGARFVESY